MSAAATLAAALREIAESDDPDARRSFLFGRTEAREIGELLEMLGELEEPVDQRGDDPETEARNRRNLKRRVIRARRYPGNTSPASRHLHTIGLALINRESYPMLAEEPEHCGETVLIVLEDYWKMKSKLSKLEGGS